MEGLEITELKQTAAFDDNDVYRLDSEYFSKSNLFLLDRLRTRAYTRLRDLAKVTDGIHQSIDFSTGGRVRIISAKHPKENYIADGQFETVSDTYHTLNARTALRADDVIISTVGTIGNAAVVTEKFLPANSDRHIGIIRIHSSISPYFLSTVLLTKYGRTQTQREATGNVQLNLFISKLNELFIPRFSSSFEDAVARFTEQAYVLRDSAKDALQSAEQLLARNLGLEDGTPPEALSYQRTLRQVNAASRFDAEYYDPHVQKIMATLARQSTAIRDVAELRSEPFKARFGELFQYIEISDVSQEGRAGGTVLDGSDAPSRAKWLVRHNDVITSTVRPIRRLSALIEPEDDGAVASSGFAVLRPSGLPPEVLLTYLRLPVICELMDLHTTASMYPAIAVKDILDLPLLRPNISAEQEIVNYVRWARLSSERASELLQRAKHAVDLAIEQSEEAALAYLRS